MVGEKVAIVSPKPQTTRDRILGVLNEPGLQIAFLDTPGIYRSKTVLSERMMKTAESSAKDVDLILYVHDGHKGVTDADISLMRRYLALGEPMLIAYTKTDIMPAENIPADAQKLFEAGISCTVVPVSARRGKNISKLKDAIAELLPEGEPLFPEDVLSDKSEKFMVGEIMREGIHLRKVEPQGHPHRQTGQRPQRDALRRPPRDGKVFGLQGVFDGVRQSQRRLARQGESVEGIRLRRGGQVLTGLGKTAYSIQYGQGRHCRPCPLFCAVKVRCVCPGKEVRCAHSPS